MELTSGTLLERGKYLIISTLGRGGFGITYLAEQTMAKRRVCVKEFFPKDFFKRDEGADTISLLSQSHAGTMSRFKEKFIKEAQTIAALDHPNIIHILDVFEENNTAYYVMEYVEGGSLSDVVKRGGAVAEGVAIKYIRDIASALGYIHSQKINHLDVKPGNILLRPKEDQTILIDFGLAKHYDTGGEQTSSTPVGISHGYAPIEQYKSGGVSSFSPATDIYGLGATLYYLVTGTVPPSATDMGREGVEVPSNLSLGVQRAIKKAMNYWREDRPQSIDDFLKLLDDEPEAVAPIAENTIIDVEPKSVDESTVINVEPKQTPQPKNEPKPKKERKSKRGLWLGIFLFVAAAVASFILFGGGSKESKQIDRTEQMRQDSIARAQFMADSTAKAERELFVRDSIAKVERELFVRDSTAKSERELFVRDSIAQVEREKSIRDSVNRANAEQKRLEEERKADAAARAKASLQLTNDSAVLTYEAGNHEISFTLKSPYEGLKVTADANQDWIMIDDIGDKMIYYSVKKSTSPNFRTGVVTLKYNDKSYKYTVSQGPNAEEAYKLGRQYYDDENYYEAVSYFKIAAELGHAKAQNNMGVCYRNGYSVPQNDKEAVVWYRKAAEQGLAIAQCNLGYCYDNGYGVPQDYKEAVKWYRKAAEQGDAEAQYNLGACYTHGRGVTQDHYESVKWYRKAAERGYIRAQNLLARFYFVGVEGVSKNFKEAVKWWRRAAEQGDAEGQLMLGACYQYGFGVTKNIDTAVEWYRKAARQGDETAQQELEKLGKGW